jgi:transposase
VGAPPAAERAEGRLTPVPIEEGQPAGDPLHQKRPVLHHGGREAAPAGDRGRCGSLARTRLAKSVHDAGWSAFVGMLEYKAKRYGRHFARIDRWFPSSKLCSACGTVQDKMPLHAREWTCPCGAVHSRDVNAAINILAAGRADRLNASEGQVRPPLAVAQPDEAGSRRGAA